MIYIFNNKKIIIAVKVEEFFISILKLKSNIKKINYFNNTEEIIKFYKRKKISLHSYAWIKLNKNKDETKTIKITKRFKNVKEITFIVRL